MTFRTTAVLLAVLVSAGAAAAEAGPAYSWQKPHAKVLPTGDLAWAPEPFVFEKGDAVRYIDYEGGDDSSPGTSKDKPWKHHPWDSAFAGPRDSAAGVDTYVFKRGVVYRGTLEVPAGTAGTAGQPLRLTSDPAWGKGEAVLCGSERVEGWKQGADHPDIPEPGKVWWTDLAFAPRCVWMVQPDAGVRRMALARTPNWEITNPDDIKSEWWTWKNPKKPFDNYIDVAGGRRHLAFDAEHINATRPEDYYKGAVLWTTKGWVMGSPFPTRVLMVDRERGALAFRGQWGGISYKIIRGCRYYLEDKPHYLDAPGEFWFHKQGEGGRLYLRLPGDADPNAAHVEAAKRIRVIESSGMSHVHVSGLTFRFTNVFWDLTAIPGWLREANKDVDAGCVRVLGPGEDIRVSHCRFEHVHRGVRMKAVGKQDALDGVAVCDNVFRHTDYGAVEIAEGANYGDVDPPIGRLYGVRVMRNRFEHVGLRPSRFGQGQCLTLSYPETAEVAGNVLDRVYAAGINVFGGKASGARTYRPFCRLLIHHNRVTDPLLNVDDFGGIETWQGGPAYVFSNVSGNPGGYRHWDRVLNPDHDNRFGHAYYLDGAFKNYHFNNVAWGKSKGPSGPLANTSAFQEIHSYQNTFFNNTIYNFVKGSRRQAPHAGRNKFLGNVWQGIGAWVFRHARPAKSKEAGNEAHAGPQKEQFAIETNAYARNVFYDVSDRFAVFEPSGRWHAGLAALREALEGHGALASGVGVMAESPPLRDAAGHDFRLADGSAAVDRGVRVFVPWALYAVVGEWHFTRCRQDPARVLDEHWIMTPHHVKRDTYYRRPMYPLRAVGVGADDYVQGPLEDWTDGALALNGKDQYAVLAHADLAEPFAYEAKVKDAGGWAEATVPTRAAVGRRFEVALKVNEAPEGQKIAAHLHWMKKDRFGGFNAWGGEAKPAEPGKTVTFAFTPKEKPGLDRFTLTVFLTTTGDWKDRTRVAHVEIAKADSADTAAAAKTKTVNLGGGEGIVRKTVAPDDLPTVDVGDSSFLVEVYFKTEPGHTGGGLVAKTDGKTGYELFLDGGGRVTFRVGGSGGVSAGTRAKVNDGRWHHVIAECDRKAGALRVYLDGTQAVDLRGEAIAGSLANPADFVVGRRPDGTCLAGTLEFVRVALGTLADAKTTIGELYAWQFDGPQYRDFCGRPPTGRGRDAGALESAAGR
ncbi:MAG: LamG-like jellyroll fold domain-containing protein [Phycisphaerae bacterium]